MYEFEVESSLVCFDRFKYSLNLYLLKGVDLLNVADSMDLSWISGG
jgi:hypothetical protein